MTWLSISTASRSKEEKERKKKKEDSITERKKRKEKKVRRKKKSYRETRGFGRVFLEVLSAGVSVGLIRTGSLRAPDAQSVDVHHFLELTGHRQGAITFNVRVGEVGLDIKVDKNGRQTRSLRVINRNNPEVVIAELQALHGRREVRHATQALVHDLKPKGGHVRLANVEREGVIPLWIETGKARKGRKSERNNQKGQKN